MEPKTNNNKVRILKTEGSDNDWTSTGEITSEVWDAMMTLDDFLLTLCPNPETGQFEPNVITTPSGKKVCDAGIPDGTPLDEQYAALFKSIGDQWEKVCRMIRPREEK
jgi:hypothetical protein